MEPSIIPIRDRRVRVTERMELVGHRVAAFGLLTAAMDTVPGTTAALMALGAADLVGAAALGRPRTRSAHGRCERVDQAVPHRASVYAPSRLRQAT